MFTNLIVKSQTFLLQLERLNWTQLHVYKMQLRQKEIYKHKQTTFLTEIQIN